MSNLTPPQSSPGKGMAIASMVLGICSLVIPYAGILTAIVGLVLGVLAKKRLAVDGQPSGMATAGIVMCIIALGFTILCVVICTSSLACFPWSDLVEGF